ncbi:MAG TPA: ornithine carbamoyltransferase [candidate division WOR-3 bacterium]|uniref:Ornithine carbamoyltransferase n=1 Tax=candidate division WOR-3 bacterium TaxID=2052148 RepID=A0A7C0VCF4_UNCW3|nr:ornithine carbamoyltransferase [candidate division WOR-3 bacterium]
MRVFRGRNFITLEDYSKQEIDFILEVSGYLKMKYILGEETPLLKDKTLFMIFFEQSTRTRNSLEAGMTQLGGHAHDLTPNKMQLSHGESAKDTAVVLSRMGEGIACRNCFYGTGNKYLNELAKHASIPVISMQDDVYHPLQAIADLLTIREYFGQNLKGLKVAITWAYATSHAKPLSVPQSQILLFPRYGMDVVVAHPEEFPLQRDVVDRAKRYAEEGGGSLSFVGDMREAVKDADIIIPKNWGGFAYFDTWEDSEEQWEMMKNNLKKHKDWRCDINMLKLAKKHVKIMHALPADRGNEVTDEVIDGEWSIVYDEAENRLHTGKAVLALTMGGK